MMINISNYFADRKIRLAIIGDKLSSISQGLTRLVTVLSRLIDFDESQSESRLVFAEGADPNLDEREFS